MADRENKICGECARFKVPSAGCPSYESFSEYVDGRPLMDAKSTACSDFYPVKKAKEKRTRKQIKDSGITADGCFEAIYHNGKPCFLVKDSHDFSTFETLEIDGQISSPKEQKQIPYEAYGFYKGSVPNREDLYWKVRRELQIFIDVEGIWLDVLAACVLLTYQQEKLQTVPYIFVYGDNESGKSTVLQLLKFLCYRPMYGVTVPSADIYGYLEDSDAIGCILEDEVQGIQKDTDKIKIYKAGYKQGAVVPRTVMLEHDRVIKYYQTFCFKACASEQIPQVKGFRERFIEINMVEGSPDKEWTDITKDDLKRLHDLRNMLLKWRLLTKDWNLSEVPTSMKGRLKELWMPLLQVTHGLTVHEGLLKFVEEQKGERLKTKQDTLDGHIVKTVVELYNRAVDPNPVLPFPEIWGKLAVDVHGKLDENKPNVMDTSDFFQVTKNKIGYRLREILSGRSKDIRIKDSEGEEMVTKGYVFDREKLGRIAKKYGYEVVAKLLSETSSTGVQASKSMEQTARDNVQKDAHTPPELSSLSYLATNKNSGEESTVGEIKSKLAATVQEVLEFVRSRFVEGSEEEWISFAVEAGLSEKEAESLFESLKDKDLFWFDRPSDGKTVWRWVKE